jgi:hypothetical protein
VGTIGCTFEQGLENWQEWYLDNQTWLDNITSGEYATYYEKQYAIKNEFKKQVNTILLDATDKMLYKSESYSIIGACEK